MAKIETWYNQDLKSPVKVRYLDGNVFSQDTKGNLIGVNIFDNGSVADVSGSIAANVIRADGATVAVSGVLSGNAAYVILPSAAYAVPGLISVVIKLTSGEETTTLCAIVANVYQSSTDTAVDPGTIIPSIETLIAAIEAAVATIPADYTELLIALEYSGKDGETILANSVYTVNGMLKPDGTGTSVVGNYKTTEYIPILCQDLYFRADFFSALAYASFCLYDESFTPLYIPRGTQIVYASDFPTAKYFRASVDVSTATGGNHITIGNRRAWYYIDELLSVFNSAEPAKLPLDLYKIQGLLSSNGTSVDNSFAAAHNYYTTDFIPIVGNHLYFSGGFFPVTAYRTFVLYDSTYTPVAFGLGNQVIKQDDYPTAKYLRASCEAQSETVSSFVAISTLDPSEIKYEFHVGAGQEFTTVRAGIAEAVKYKNSTLYIHPGTYDFAEEWAAEIAAASGGSIGNWLSNGIHIIFMPGSYCKALFPNGNSYTDTYFNPFIGKDFTLEGLVIEASNCRYCVHDEQAGGNYYYRNIIKNCRMKMSVSGGIGTHCQCIGGGLGKYGYIEIEGGSYESLGMDGPCISYHNGDVAGADSKIFIRDVYCDGQQGNIEIYPHGQSTVVSQVYISNCSLKSAIVLTDPAAGLPANMAVTEWNNTIRN